MDIFEKVNGQVDIQKTVEYFGVHIDRNGKGLCPFHKEKTPSFSIDKKRNSFKCFGCGVSGDSIDFVAKLKGIELIESAKLLASIFNIDIEEDNNHIPKKPTIQSYLKDCIKNIDKTDYFQKRSLTDETIKKFFLGYDTKRQSVVIPYSSKLDYYQSRSTINKKFFKPRTEDAGTEPLYNSIVISAKTKQPIFIVESPICAMSIMQCGGIAVATCGTSGWRKLVDKAKKSKFKSGFILCFDNDEPGQQVSTISATELSNLGIYNIEYNIAGKYKDPNELLVYDAKMLGENIKKASIEMRKKYATAKDSFDVTELMEEELEPISWIVEDVLPVGLGMLCAPSKIGKSWMVLQLCIAVAQGDYFLDFKTVKNECLYYALEDGKTRLKDRIGKIRQGKPVPKGIHITLKADTLETGLLTKIEQELKTFPNVKLIVIDTLQKVRGKMNKSDTLYSNDYREMASVKDFADKHKICILFVHHLRKMADDSDVFNMISGSTALMGAADTIFIISKKKRGDDNAKFTMTGRDIQQSDLVISFNESNYVWEVEGTAEEIAIRREREEYESNIYVKTIKELVKRNPIGGWSGSAQDLIKAVYDVTGKQVVDSTTAVGKMISRYENKLYYDDIDHKATKSNQRKHTFTKRLPYVPVYQRTLYEKDD